MRERADSCLFVLSSPLMDSRCLCSRFNPRGTAPLIPSTSQGHRQTLARRPCWPWGPETDKALGPAVRRGRARGPTQSHRCLLVLPRGAGDWAGGEDPACASLARRVAPPRSRHVECHLCCLLSFTLWFHSLAKIKPLAAFREGTSPCHLTRENQCHALPRGQQGTQTQGKGIAH